MATDPEKVPLRTFEYSPVSPGYIRVLDIVSSPAEPLRCSLRTVKLGEPDTVFTALSYVWGDGAQPFAMDVVPDNKTIPLTTSLHNALQDLRDCADVQPKTFWADQICINQMDIEEKSHQVAQMDRVYACAKQVVTYLGPGEEGDNDALDLCLRIHEYFDPLMATSELAGLNDATMAEFAGKYTRMELDDIPEELFFPEEIFDGDGWKKFVRLDNIVSGTWVTRLWLLQENILNNKTAFLRGARTIPWDPIHLVCVLSWVGLVPKIKLGNQVTQMVRVRKAWSARESEPTDLLELQNLMSNFKTGWQCWDPRDRVYSVLGVAVDARELGLVVPDYKKSTAQVFTDVAVAYTRRQVLEAPQESLLILRSVCREPSTYADMPSWVPTYTDMGYKARPWAEINASQTDGNDVARELAAQVVFESTGSVENGVLVAKGLRLGLKLGPCLGTFPGRWLLNSLDKVQLDQVLTTLLQAREQFGDSDQALASLYETVLLGLEIVETNKLQDPESTIRQLPMSEAAQGVRDMINLFQRAKSGDDDEVWSVEDAYFYDQFYLSTASLPREPESAAHRLLEYSDEFMNRSLWVVEDSNGCCYPCMAPGRAQAGDVPVILFGAYFVCFIRPCDGMFEFVGIGYIAGFMSGEPFDVDGWKETVEDFRLV
ncbi:heterokaryon incompatibility protein-domain-containing protein [Diaporthe sp. PMI_573]|nr:heterokaryon incompatibility protein-domain-containing protein [Diaporthaceae sp. PMI_573]